MGECSQMLLPAERLSPWLAEHVPGFGPLLGVERFAGGQSNPTYKLVGGGAALVLRAKPSGALLPGAHAVDREFRVIRALHGAEFPVARPYALCTDEGVIGTMFYVMEHVDGRIFWDATLPGVQDRAAYFDAMNATIARLHGFDPDALGLSGYGRPGSFFARQIARWSKQYLEDEAAGRDANMDQLVEWLPAHVPAGDETAIVHGDFRCDNMIFHASEPRVLAVIDWELSTLGHPLADFAYHAMMYRMPASLHSGLAEAGLEALGIPSEEEYVAAYCRRTGREGISDWDFYIAFNMFRFAAIVHGIKGRVIRGTAASARAHEAAAKFEPLAALAWAQAERAGR